MTTNYLLKKDGVNSELFADPERLIKTLTAAFALACLLPMLTGCSRLPPPTQSSIQNNTCTDPFFGLELHVPNGWTLGTKKDFDLVTGVVDMKEQTPPDEAQKRNAENDKVSRLLLFAMKEPLEETSISNSSIVLTVIDGHLAPDVTTPKDIMERILAAPSGAFPHETIVAPRAVKLGSREFYRADVRYDVNDHSCYEAFFTTTKRKWALLMCVTAPSPSEVDKILATAFPASEKH